MMLDMVRTSAASPVILAAAPPLPALRALEKLAYRTPKFEACFQNLREDWFAAYASADYSVRFGRYVTCLVVSMLFTGYKKANLKR